MRRAAAAAAALVLAGCGGGAGGDAPSRGGSPYGAAGRSVEEARRAGGTQTVRGSLVAAEGEVRLCTALLESHPPQCGEPSLRVEGLDVASLEGLASAEGVTWSERELALHGRVEDGVLRVGGG